MIAATQRWPDAFAERYRARGYWRGDTFTRWFQRRADASCERTAVVGGSTRWTYGELETRAERLASGFLGLGLRPGDRVVVQLPNVPVFVVVILALFKARLLPVFALPAHRRTEIADIASASEAAAYVVADLAGGFDYRRLADEVRQLVPTLQHVIVAGDPGPFRPLRELEEGAAAGLPGDADPSDVAFMQLSGGSTGASKLIPRTHDDYIYSFRASAGICGLDEDSVYLVVLPVAHNFPMSSPGILGTFDAGGTVVLSPSPAPDVAFPLIARERVTMTALVPPLAIVWLDAVASLQPDLSSLEVVQVGGAKLTPEVARRIKPGLGATLQQVFGMAEGLVNYTRLDDPEDAIVSTQGRPISEDDEILVVDEAGAPVAAGKAGHLLTRGPYTIRAYHNAPEANARAFTADGFYRTGDVVRRTPEGNLVVLGRATDQINRGGEKVSAEEVEDHLVAHPQVRDAVVISIPDRYLGERSCAFIVSRGERTTPAALREWILGRGLARYKVPDRIVFVDELPSTAVGKTSRKDLRAAFRRRWDAEQASAGAGGEA